MTVAIRLGLRGGGSALDGVARDAAAGARARARRVARRGTTTRDAWAFFLAGLLAPGLLADPLHARRSREVGASRTSVAAGDGAALRARDRLHLPRRAGRGAARASARSRSSAAASRSSPSATGPGTCGSRGLALRARRGGALRRARQHRPRAARARQPGDGGRGDDARRGRRRPRSTARRAADAARAARPRAGRASSSGSRTSACSRRTSTAGCRSSRRSSRPSRLWGVGLSALVFRGHRGGRAARLVLGAVVIVAGGALIGVSASP